MSTEFTKILVVFTYEEDDRIKVSSAAQYVKHYPPTGWDMVDIETKLGYVYGSSVCVVNYLPLSEDDD